MESCFWRSHFAFKQLLPFKHVELISDLKLYELESLIIG